MTGLEYRPHWLYRLYDADGFLLYIGCTSDIKKRIPQHRQGSFGARVATFEAEAYPDRESAFEAEALAIRRERPPLNIRHNTGQKLTPYSATHRRPPRPTEENHMLEPDHTLKEVSVALGMSERWIRKQVADGAEHQRYGHKIRFTTEQVEKLRSQATKNAVPLSVTTGKKRRSA